MMRSIPQKIQVVALSQPSTGKQMWFQDGDTAFDFLAENPDWVVIKITYSYDKERKFISLRETNNEGENYNDTTKYRSLHEEK
jgi:hypothetical protein